MQAGIDFTARCMAAEALANGGSGGTSDYTQLTNKPSINNVELDGNKTSTNLGLQSAIDSAHKLDADLVDDTSSTNKFATAAELAQIETNKNNISSIFSLLAGCQFFYDTRDRKDFTFTVKRRNGNARYRYGLFITGDISVMPTLYSIFADTNNSVTITKLAGDSEKTFTGTLSYDSSGVGNLGISVGINAPTYGGLRGIWFD